VNYLVKELLKAGYIRASRFKNSRNKIAYMYVLTSRGMSVKLIQTYNFLRRKLAEYHRLTEEIEALRQKMDIPKEVGDREVGIHENESAYVPKLALHKPENPGKVPLEIIEVQAGSTWERTMSRGWMTYIYGRHKG
jgi:hypothetical protein